jgi:PIN domain nuclease of toxin-antitoxin system
MRLLLDTSAFIWLTNEPGKLSLPAAGAIDDPTNDLVLSHASVWEICLKHLTGKLQLPSKPRTWISQQMAVWQIEAWPLELESLYRTNELPRLHKDPFDRSLVAQAQIYGFTIVSPDPCFPSYGVSVIW